MAEKTEGQIIELNVAHRGNDYICSVDGNPKVWACGKTSLEAIGECVVVHQDVLGVKINWHKTS